MMCVSAQLLVNPTGPRFTPVEYEVGRRPALALVKSTLVAGTVTVTRARADTTAATAACTDKGDVKR
jgi:hypothetical protein